MSQIYTSYRTIVIKLAKVVIIGTLALIAMSGFAENLNLDDQNSSIHLVS